MRRSPMLYGIRLAVCRHRAVSVCKRWRTDSSASITVLPVTTTASAGTPSLSRLRRERSVGAKCKAASDPVTLRLASSGQGE